MRIVGVNVPLNKRIPFSLAYINGIGISSANKICEVCNVTKTLRVSDLTNEEVSRINEFIRHNYTVEGELKKEVSMNIKSLVEIGCYRGVRHRKGLPVRGQRTHSNARTRKGKSRPIAGKK